MSAQRPDAVTDVRKPVALGGESLIESDAVAAFGYLPPVVGALLRDGIDVAVIPKARS